MSSQIIIEVVATIIINPNNKNKFLMHKRSDGRYEFPGGKKKKNETFEDAAKREVKEETSLIITKQILIQSMEWITERNEKYICEYFFAIKFEGEPKHMEPDKGTNWEWIDYKKISEEIKTNCVASLKQFSYESFNYNYDFWINHFS
jgi:8-oxo-dGTP diphosphatase